MRKWPAWSIFEQQLASISAPQFYESEFLLNPHKMFSFLSQDLEISPHVKNFSPNCNLKIPEFELLAKIGSITFISFHFLTKSHKRKKTAANKEEFTTKILQMLKRVARNSELKSYFAGSFFDSPDLGPRRSISRILTV